MALASLVMAAAALSAPPAAAGPRPAGAAAAAGPRAERVLLVSAPYLTWADVREHRGPALGSLLARSAVASMSLRTIGARTSLADGYLTVGAGNRARVGGDGGGEVLAPSEPFEGSTAADVFARRTGAEPTGGALALNMAAVEQSNRRLLYGALPGALGATLADHGTGAAVIANGDLAGGSEPHGFHREAALALIDRAGRVAGGDVGRDLLAEDAGAPFGLRLDADAVQRSFSDAWTGRAVVLLELSDLARAEAYEPLVTGAAEEARRRQARAASDEILGRVLSQVDWDRDAVILFAPAASPRGPERLAVAALAAPGLAPGRAKSATTRRAGYVTLPDVAPTVLGLLGIEPAPSMSGTEMSGAGGPRPGPALFASLAEDDARAVFRYGVYIPITVVFLVFQVVVYGLAVFVLSRRHVRMRGVVAFLALMVLAAPPVLFLAGLLPVHEMGAGAFSLAVVAAGAGLAAVAMVAGRQRPAVGPLMLITLNLVVLLGDVATGGRLQLDTVFGNSSLVAGRFSGYGNLAFGLLAMSAIATATGGWGLLGGRDRRSLALVLGLFAMVLIADGHPALGSDIGGVLTLVPAFAVVLLLLARLRLSPARVATIALATVALLALFAAVDLSRPPEEHTHLARLAARILDGESGFATVIRRKMAANISILTGSLWSYMLPLAVAFLGVLLWRPPNVLHVLQDRHPGLRVCLIGGLCAGVLGSLLNDSGVAVAAIMLAVALPYLTVLAMRLPPPDPVPSDTAGGPAPDSPPAPAQA